MRLIVEKESFKVFSKTMQTCTKLGEDIFFECAHDYFTIKSVNDARSLFFFTKFDQKFFEEYAAPEAIECKFKSKSCIIPFKSAVALEKNINTLEFYVDKVKDGATFQMNLDTDDMTVHEIGYINTSLQVDLDEDVRFENYLMAKVSTLVHLFANFSNVNDYCVMKVVQDKIYFETYNFKINEVRIAFTGKSDVFLEYKIKGSIRSTFTVKPMKTFLNSLDKNANCYFYFDEDNCPIHAIIKSNFLEHKFIIASIDIDIDSMHENTTSIPAPKELENTQKNPMQTKCPFRTYEKYINIEKCMKIEK